MVPSLVHLHVSMVSVQCLYAVCMVANLSQRIVSKCGVRTLDFMRSRHKMGMKR
jgi:hypothetical protein